MIRPHEQAVWNDLFLQLLEQLGLEIVIEAVPREERLGSGTVRHYEEKVYKLVAKHDIAYDYDLDANKDQEENSRD